MTFILGSFEPKWEQKWLVLILKLLYLETRIMFQCDGAISLIVSVNSLHSLYNCLSYCPIFRVVTYKGWRVRWRAEPMIAFWLLIGCIFLQATVVISSRGSNYSYCRRKSFITSADERKVLASAGFQADCWLPLVRKLLELWVQPAHRIIHRIVCLDVYSARTGAQSRRSRDFQNGKIHLWIQGRVPWEVNFSR